MTNNFSPEQIEKLVQKSQRGDEKSFSKLFDIFFDKISRYVQFRVKEEDSEDLVSEIFLKLVENINKYKNTPKASFNSWIFRIAHNTVIDFYRKKKELLGLSDEETEQFFMQIPDNEPTSAEKIDKNIEIKKLYEVLKKLPIDQREILEFKYLEGLSNTEIAHITGKSEGNIRVIQLRSLREIRKMWGENNG